MIFRVNLLTLVWRFVWSREGYLFIWFHNPMRQYIYSNIPLLLYKVLFDLVRGIYLFDSIIPWDNIYTTTFFIIMWEFVEIYLTYEGCLSVWSYYEYCWSELLHTQCFFFFFYFQVEEVGLMVPSITLKSLLRVDLLKKYHLYFMGYEITKKKKIEVEFDVWRSCVDKVPSSAAVSMEEGWREKGCINHLHSGLLSLFMKGWSVWKKPSKSRIYFFSFWKCFYIKLKSLKTRCMNMIDHTWSRKQQSFWYSTILIRNPIWMESRLRTE